MSTSLSTIKALIIDMDGVLWRGAQPLPGIADFFSFTAERGIRFLLATNNATRTVASVIERMQALGVRVAPALVLTSANATARWLKHEIPAGSAVYAVGEEALRDELAEVGFRVMPPVATLAGEAHAAAVVVGLDRGLTYEKLREASAEIRAGARFIATNGDATFPTEGGLVPGAGSLVAAVQTATSVDPTIVGKPYRPMFDAALEILGTARSETAMLGDRLDTDIQGGQNAGLGTILVLTGVTTLAEAAESPIKPDFKVANLMELREMWAHALDDK